MPKIPRHFHFVFGLKPQVEPFHVVYYLCLKSCLDINRPERITLYYHYEPHGEWWEMIRPHLELEQVPLVPQVSSMNYTNSYARENRHAHHADFIRLEKLRDKGGVYADMDTLFIRPLPDHLFEKSCVLGREADLPYEPGSSVKQESLCNALIMAEPGAPFVRRWLEGMPAAFCQEWSAHSCQLAARLRWQFPEEVHVEPERSFYPYMWTPAEITRLLVECHGDWEGVYSVHLWNHLWWSRHRFKFTSFNGERLTERFIRQGSTTYTKAARCHLPDANRHGVVRRYLRDTRELAAEFWARRTEFRRWLRSRVNG